MLSAAEKAYKAYKKIIGKWNPFTQTTTSELNVLYNARLRFDKDESFKKEALELTTDEGESLDILIDKFFNAYNNRHGLDIRETLVEFDDPELADGCYFIIRAYVGDKEVSPVDLKAGGCVRVVATLYSYASDTPLKVPEISLDVVADEYKSLSKSVKNSSEIDFEITLDSPGHARFKVFAKGDDGKVIIGSEGGYGGLLFSKEKILPTHPVPKDFADFWRTKIDKMLAHDHLGKTPDGYTGAVKYEYNMAEKNFYEVTKVDEEFLRKMRENLLSAPEDTDLLKYDIYRVYLKSPGPCHSSAFITVPKGAKPKSLPIHYIFDGYGVYSAEPVLHPERISVHCTHHGYELGNHRDNYYPYLNNTVCHYYGRGGKEINAGYEDISDCYMTYLLLRDLQMVHFAANPDLCGDIEGLSDAYSGKAIISGGSMGGYQSICIGGLITLLNEKAAPIEVERILPNIPAFCNIAGHTEGRVKTYLTTYEDGVDYFDAAQFAHLITAPVQVDRIGLGDDTCPAGGIVAMLNSLGGDFEANMLQNSSHGFIPDTRFQKWYKYTKSN
ncbi:MAG: hypothetical protein J6D20_01805 [Clostridia bacterium]|nr:hypothetical protein [Clostridia bacterium]